MDLAFSSALWTTEKASGEKVSRVYEVDPLIAILAQLASKAQKVEQMSTIQMARLKCKHCRWSHESVNCTMGSPFIQSVENANYTQNFQRQ